MVPSESCATVYDRERPRRKRNAYAFGRIRLPIRLSTFEKGQYRIRFEGDIEDCLSIRESVIAMEVEIGRISFEIPKDEYVRSPKGLESSAKAVVVRWAARSALSDEFAKTRFDSPCVIGQAPKLGGVDLLFIEVDLRPIVLLPFSALRRYERCVFDFFQKSIGFIG